MAEEFRSGNFEDGTTLSFYAAMAPDKGIGIGESFRRHARAFTTTPATFYRGGISYSITRSGTDVMVKVLDAYTILSMIRVNETVNRIPNKITPLGKTTVEFRFIYKDQLAK